MKQSYLDGKDLYADTASKVYNVPYSECLESFGKEGKQRRTNMKSIILGIMYSRGAKSIAEQLGVTKKEAEGIIKRFNDSFPLVEEFVNEQLRFCKQNGYIYTVWGRKCRIPDLRLSQFEFGGEKVDEQTKAEITKELDGIWSRDKRDARIKFYRTQFGIHIKNNYMKISNASRQVVNSVIQGSASDMVNEACVMIYNDKEFRELGGRLLLTVHDEIIGEAPKANALKALARMELLMVAASDKYLSLPMKCDGVITERWEGNNLKPMLMEEQNETQ